MGKQIGSQISSRTGQDIDILPICIFNAFCQSKTPETLSYILFDLMQQ